MSRIDTDHVTIVSRIVARLRSELALPDHRCYETLVPLVDPPIPKGGPFFVTVSPGGGRFDDAMFVGGGENQVSEQASVTVCAYAKIALDPGDRATQIMTEETRGMLRLKQRILKALSGHDLTDASGDTLLRSLLQPLQDWEPQYNFESKIARIGVGFATDFDWDLS